MVPKELRKKPAGDVLAGEFDYAKMLRSGGDSDFQSQEQQLPRLLKPKIKSENIKRKTGFSKSKLGKNSPPPSAHISIKTVQKKTIPPIVVDGITLVTGEHLVDILVHSPRDESIFDGKFRDADVPGKQVTVSPVLEATQTERMLDRDYLMLDLRDEPFFREYHIYDAIHCPQILLNQDKYPAALYALVVCHSNIRS